MPVPKLRLRFMRESDVPALMPIEREAFATSSWDVRSFYFEINSSNCSHMLVVERCQTLPVQGLRRVVSHFIGQTHSNITQCQIVSYGGLWRIEDEAHVSTIATDAQYRGQGFGELALLGMLSRAVWLGAEYVILEVRVSNDVAQRLYRKYGFITTETKRKYYQNGEDAYEMRLDLTSPIKQQLEVFYHTNLQRHAFEDRYTQVPHPRRG